MFRDKKVLFIGDSILRDLDNYLYHLVDYEYKVFCLPGARVKNLRTFVKDLYADIVFEEETSYLVVHVGTNNLESGLWERDRKDYIALINILKETFRSATIIFSAILPRWDSDELYEKSLYFNNRLEQLCIERGCFYIDASADILDLDNGFYRDGLHLSSTGKAFFAYFLDLCVVRYIDKRERVPSNKCSSWIPKELKRLWTPKPEKRKKKEEKETDRRSTCRTEKRKSLPRSRRKKVHVSRSRTTHDAEGFVFPWRTSRVKPLPQLPKNRHVGERIPVWIPYINVQTANTCSRVHEHVPLPAQRKPYVRRRCERKRRRKDRKAHQRKKRKVHHWFEVPEHHEFVASKPANQDIDDLVSSPHSTDNEKLLPKGTTQIEPHPSVLSSCSDGTDMGLLTHLQPSDPPTSHNNIQTSSLAVVVQSSGKPPDPPNNIKTSSLAVVVPPSGRPPDPPTNMNLSSLAVVVQPSGRPPDPPTNINTSSLAVEVQPSGRPPDTPTNINASSLAVVVQPSGRPPDTPTNINASSLAVVVQPSGRPPDTPTNINVSSLAVVVQPSGRPPDPPTNMNSSSLAVVIQLSGRPPDTPISHTNINTSSLARTRDFPTSHMDPPASHTSSLLG